MFYKGFFKRIIPFFLTFAAGLFIASFFVSISGPGFRGRGFGGRHKEMKRLHLENEMLRNENLRLKNQMETQTWAPLEIPSSSHDHFRGHGPEVPVEGPPPPRAPRATR